VSRRVALFVHTYNTYVHTLARLRTYIHAPMYGMCRTLPVPCHVLRSPKAINDVGEAAAARELLQRFSRKTISVTCLTSFPLESVRDYPSARFVAAANQLRDQ